MNTMVAIFEVKKYMEKETLDKANCIQGRINRLERLELILSDGEEINVRAGHNITYFPAICESDYKDYEALRETIKHLVYMEVIKAKKELDAL